MRAVGQRTGYVLGSAGSSLRLLRFATALRVTRRSPGREELPRPKASFRPGLTGRSINGHLATRPGGPIFTDRTDHVSKKPDNLTC